MFVLCLTLLVSLSLTSAYATADSESEESLSGSILSPMWTNLSTFQNNFWISSGGSANVYTYASATSADEIRLSVYIQRYSGGSWSNVKQWLSTQSGSTAIINESWTVSSGYYYRMVSYVYVYVGGSLSESASSTSSSVYY